MARQAADLRRLGLGKATPGGYGDAPTAELLEKDYPQNYTEPVAAGFAEADYADFGLGRVRAAGSDTEMGNNDENSPSL